jgi:predicted RNA-binding Zn-ribbon protein involved in translation (DUF1610 family)
MNKTKVILTCKHCGQKASANNEDAPSAGDGGTMLKCPNCGKGIGR